jgi:hypothetical protein
MCSTSDDGGSSAVSCSLVASNNASAARRAASGSVARVKASPWTTAVLPVRYDVISHDFGSDNRSCTMVRASPCKWTMNRM